ncbi:MAG TPA: hypothetical protein VLG44_00165 [Chlamydiales bacterium]|nr:hypothetical protein [Chlamydiales bacterium]
MDPIRRRTTEENRLSAIEIANLDTQLMEIGDAATKAIAELNRQREAVPSLFEALAGSLHSFSISVVGIVARYAV